MSTALNKKVMNNLWKKFVKQLANSLGLKAAVIGYREESGR